MLEIGDWSHLLSVLRVRRSWEAPLNKSSLSKLTQLMQYYQNKSNLSFKTINNDINNNMSIKKFSEELLVLLTLLLLLQAHLQQWWDRCKRKGFPRWETFLPVHGEQEKAFVVLHPSFCGRLQKKWGRLWFGTAAAWGWVL